MQLSSATLYIITTTYIVLTLGMVPPFFSNITLTLTCYTGPATNGITRISNLAFPEDSINTAKPKNGHSNASGPYIIQIQLISCKLCKMNEQKKPNCENLLRD